MPIPPTDFATVESPAQLTFAEALASVRELQPKILAQAAETEARTYYSEELHLDFMRAGLYNMLRPATFGGYEFDVADYLKIVREIARSDMSTAWCFCLASAHVLWMASWWRPRRSASSSRRHTPQPAEHLRLAARCARPMAAGSSTASSPMPQAGRIPHTSSVTSSP